MNKNRTTNTMKVKRLFLMLAIASMAVFTLAACSDDDSSSSISSSKSTCFCNIEDLNGNVLVNWNDDEADSSLTITNFNGKCANATWSNLPSSPQDWAALDSTSFKLVCSEK